jgi:magnesium-transporting ATPase (P-type)
MKNMRSTPIKKSLLEVLTNNYIYAVFTFHIVLCLALVVAKTIWEYFSISSDWYQAFSVNDQKFINIVYEAFVLFWSNFILFSKLVPITLYTTSEVTKVFQSQLISWDMKMHDKERDILSKANTATIIDDLGCVNVIFSDKTGTLTKNQMKLLKCSINGKK